MTKPRLFVRYMSIRWVQTREFEWEAKIDGGRAIVSRASNKKWYVHVWYTIGIYDISVSVDKPHNRKERAFDTAEDLLMNGIPNESVEAAAKRG